MGSARTSNSFTLPVSTLFYREEALTSPEQLDRLAQIIEQARKEGKGRQKKAKEGKGRQSEADERTILV